MEELIPDKRISPNDRREYQNPAKKNSGPYLYNIPARRMLRRSQQPEITRKINDIYQCLGEKLNLGFMKKNVDPRDGGDFSDVHGFAMPHQHSELADQISKPFDDPACTKFWIWIEYDSLVICPHQKDFIILPQSCTHKNF